MADNSSEQDKLKKQIGTFSDTLPDIRSILNNFKKEIPEVVEKIVNDRLGNDKDKLYIMEPALE